MTKTQIKYALLSVSDKSGLADLARSLKAKGVNIISTGGTAKMLAENGISTIPVAEITGSPEMMDGRIKTLHPKIHGGLLAKRDNPKHQDDLKRSQTTPIDLVVVNLYPFEKILAQNASHDDLIENIDIGGPALIRAAAKNHAFVTVITETEDYQKILDEINAGGTTLQTRQNLAAKAFAHTAHYDATIAQWMRQQTHDETLPKYLTLAGRRIQKMRYGENPHQNAALYQTTNSNKSGILNAQQIQGKPLSYNNINDASTAFELVAEFSDPTIAIIKHANPAGVASNANLNKAWQAALASDPVSAFGGIVALNRPLTAEIAENITQIFTEVIIAPKADNNAKNIIAQKPNLRLLITHDTPEHDDKQQLVLRTIKGGFLAQTPDTAQPKAAPLTCMTKRHPTQTEINDLTFAMTVAKHLASNAIVFAKNNATVALGGGQTSRLDACRIAIQKAQYLAKDTTSLIGSVVASDAFFPFADAIEAAARAGATAIIQPGGAKNDQDVINAADDANLAMIFTSQRHFRH